MTTSHQRLTSDRVNSNPIGIFDSGLGGLTVAKKIYELLPGENVVYFGDTARFPYGPRSQEIVRKISFQNTNFLLAQNVKFIVVACNTASALALDELKRYCKKPMIGVVEPGAYAAANTTRNGKIGVIGTVGTINSRAYQKAIHRCDPKLTVYSLPCPLFVSLAEEGYTNREATRLIAAEYLDPLIKHRIDTLVLGCTHYPLLKKVISQTMGKTVNLIDSAEETAKEVVNLLKQHRLLRKTKRGSYRRYFVSDIPDRFVEVGKKILKEQIKEVIRIDIDKY